MTENRTYDDILHLPHHVSSRHPQMPREKRAAQFAPFAALTGYEDALAETTRPLVQRIELSDDEKVRLDRHLQELATHIQDQPAVTITWFQEDLTAQGGFYVTTKGHLKTIDAVHNGLILTNGNWIPICDILSL